MNKIMNSVYIGAARQDPQPTPAEPDSITESLRSLAIRVDTLDNCIDILSSKLYPLRNTSPVCNDQTARVQTGSEVREWINTQNDRLENFAERLRILTNEIDL